MSKSIQTTVSAPAKAAPVGRANPVKAAQADGVKFALKDGAGIRPTGAQLFAYTAAWLTVSGMTEGKAIPRAVITKIAGPRVVAHHAPRGNMDIGGPSDNNMGPLVTLTEKGLIHMLRRGTDAAAYEAYCQMMTDGKPNKYCKADHIRPV